MEIHQVFLNYRDLDHQEFEKKRIYLYKKNVFEIKDKITTS